MSALTDRAQHVADTIDQALEDWGTSPDAMRWSPPEPNFDCPAIASGTPVEQYAAVHGVDGFAARAAVGLTFDETLSAIGVRLTWFQEDVLRAIVGTPRGRALAVLSGRMNGRTSLYTAAVQADRSTRGAVGQALLPSMRATVESLSLAFRVPVRVSGGEPLSPRERALAARRNRNTGPADGRRLDGSHPRRRQ